MDEWEELFCKMELVKREWVDCGELQQQEEGDEGEKEERTFRVVQWNTLADGKSWFLMVASQTQLESVGLDVQGYDCK